MAAVPLRVLYKHSSSCHGRCEPWDWGRVGRTPASPGRPWVFMLTQEQCGNTWTHWPQLHFKQGNVGASYPNHTRNYSWESVCYLKPPHRFQLKSFTERRGSHFQTRLPRPRARRVCSPHGRVGISLRRREHVGRPRWFRSGADSQGAQRMSTTSSPPSEGPLCTGRVPSGQRRVQGRPCHKAVLMGQCWSLDKCTFHYNTARLFQLFLVEE